MKCNYCGAELSDDTEFCYACGGKVRAEETPREIDAVQSPYTETAAAEEAKQAVSPKPKRWYAKPWLYIVLAVAIAALVLVVTGAAEDIVAFVLEGPSIPINFDSAKMEDAVRSRLDIWDKEVTNKDVAEITELDLQDCGISGIEALVQFKGLTILNLKGNQISDISPLAELVNLTQLNLQENQIGDISALSELCGLTELRLSENSISDIGALSQMNDLGKLSLDKNQIEDISALTNLLCLTELDLSDNKIGCVEGLSGLGGLEFLNLNNNQLNNINPLSTLSEAKEINLNNNQLSDISALSGCACLTKLDVQNNPIEDISPASRIKTLASIDITGTNISDISAVAGKAQVKMDQPETINIKLKPGEYFMIHNLKLPVDTGDAKITWTSSDTDTVTAESDGKIQTTNVHTDAWYESLYKEAVITGKIENVNAEIKCRIIVSQDTYNFEWDEKKLTYKFSGWKATGYAFNVKPALKDVIGVDLTYEVNITRGKLSKFALRALVDGKWKNFGTIDVKDKPEGTTYIDFGEPAEITKYWLVPKEKKTGQWNDYEYFDTVYYALREADLGELQAVAD